MHRYDFIGRGSSFARCRDGWRRNDEDYSSKHNCGAEKMDMTLRFLRAEPRCLQQIETSREKLRSKSSKESVHSPKYMKEVDFILGQ